MSHSVAIFSTFAEHQGNFAIDGNRRFRIATKSRTYVRWARVASLATEAQRVRQYMNSFLLMKKEYNDKKYLPDLHHNVIGILNIYMHHYTR